MAPVRCREKNARGSHGFESYGDHAFQWQWLRRAESPLFAGNLVTQNKSEHIAFSAPLSRPQIPSMKSESSLSKVDGTRALYIDFSTWVQAQNKSDTIAALNPKMDIYSSKTLGILMRASISDEALNPPPTYHTTRVGWFLNDGFDYPIE